MPVRIKGEDPEAKGLLGHRRIDDDTWAVSWPHAEKGRAGDMVSYAAESMLVHASPFKPA